MKRFDVYLEVGAKRVFACADRASANLAECARFERVIRAGWRALDSARKQATGKVLRKGPRGGGRELDAIVRHVADADGGHLAAVGWKHRLTGTIADRVDETRSAVIEALGASARGEIAARGPRGGSRWPVRFFVRRVAWHAIAHAWEIERRVHQG